jgi:hypothetical protein
MVVEKALKGERKHCPGSEACHHVTVQFQLREHIVFSKQKVYKTTETDVQMFYTKLRLTTSEVT